jgi:hypothetical protein
MLWGRSGNKCAMTDCKIDLVMDMSETDDESLIGEECHIIAQKTNGPRGDDNYPPEKIDKYNNLILMCRNHHKIIDDNPSNYPIEDLVTLKREHEAWVKTKLENYNEQQQKDDEVYATFIDKWMELANIDNWKNWTSWMFSADEPRLTKEMDTNLLELRDWLFARIWPKRYIELEEAFENFRLILEDMQNTFHKHSKKTSDLFYTEKFYQISDWNPDEYKRLSKIYSFHVFLVEDLVIELTRAANNICTLIRKNIDSSFRLNEGLIIITIGPFMGFEYKDYRTEYTVEELTSKPYKGIESFKKVRITRDFCRGVGTDVNDPKFLEFY